MHAKPTTYLRLVDEVALAAAIAMLAMLTACTTQAAQEAGASRQAVAGANPDNALSNGEILYGYRCKGCHEPATPGAPDRKKLSTYEPRKIVKSLTSGSMKILAPGLSKRELQEIAAFPANDG
jgi:cytochrome c5